ISKMDNFIQVIDGIETIYEEDLEHLERLDSYETESDDIEYDSATTYEITDENTVIYFTKELTSHIVNHVLTPIEYPATSPEGVAYIFNVEGWEESLAVFKDIQYSIGKPGGEYKVMCPYLNVEVKREMHTCQGSKLCEFSVDELQNKTHQSMDIDSDLMTHITQEISPNNLDNNTFDNKLCEGKPILHRLIRQNSSESTYFIGCASWKFNEKNHRFIRIPSNINIELLSNLFNGIYEAEDNQIQPINKCYTVLSNSSKKKYCVKFFTGQPSKFKHIHESGWNCIVGDLDIAQIIRLGETLALIDSLYSWEEHLIYIYKLCQVHFKRKLFKKKFTPEIKIEMESLLTTTTENIDNIFNKLILNKDIIDWVQFYQKPYIITSLNPNISNISYNDWHAAPNSTNCAEAVHSMSNYMRYFKRIEIKKNYNINLSGHDKSGIKQKILAIKRSIRKQFKTNTSKKKSSIKTSKNKQPQRLIESNSDKNDPPSNINNELVMTPIEKLEYEECMLLIEERKEKLR
ncbi:4329_t:CDS:10, partial [Cetraspora pellucida]